MHSAVGVPCHVPSPLTFHLFLQFSYHFRVLLPLRT
jgi:hypothetical protein